jgi:hypothetical protein
MSSATAQKRAAFSILRFLNESLQNGTIKADDAEGIEVASESLSRRLELCWGDGTDVFRDVKASASPRRLESTPTRSRTSERTPSKSRSTNSCRR